ncbi:DUF4232 domain-containing protein [Streptomyces sp. NPDC087425]|uniref:DUF4232 domain-containing protein n=1 Tax=unclassified Streptomyces TaxID=2593676 RepID=UPI00380762DA
MSSIRTSRTRLLTVAATVALAGLSLTACGDGSGVTDEGAAAHTSTITPSSGDTPSEKATVPTSAKGGDTSDTAGNSTSTQGGSSAGSSDSKSSVQTPAENASSSSKAVTCEGSNTKTVAAPLTRPVNHLLLTVTNTGSKTCFLYGYPSVQFTDAQSVPPVIEESQPQAVVTLEPGQSGYASVALSASDGSGGKGRKVNDLNVYFSGRSMNGSVGKGAHPSLPSGGVYIDDSVKVTYWQQEMSDAINW